MSTTTHTAIATILRAAGEFAHGGTPDTTAGQWHLLGFAPDEVRTWLDARVFDPTAAKQLRDLHITPERAATRVTVSGYTDTVGYAVSNGDMTARHAARMLADA